ncbi:MAG: phosphoribosylformylglycinamidine synthase I [Candidatus Cloacimonadota bacterium]|nr:phosphoribosylformylglycinamidine synthase I [Candidatus Cloacimonadota bacterium]
MRVSVLVFPGSNCDYDSYYISKIRGAEVNFVWHKNTDLKNPDIVYIPGGFSYGDYLRSGALAKSSPVINEVIKYAEKGGLVFGICNGFQILTETHLLSGTLMMNEGLKFICKHQNIIVENNKTPFTNRYDKDDVLDIPIAHKEGNYYVDDEEYKSLIDNNQVVFRYCSSEGEVDKESNPNGSRDNIAGICNKQGNVIGMMPHPERAAESITVSQDGMKVFASIEKYISERIS